MISIAVRSPEPPKPAIGIVCCNETAGRPIQAVATRFIDPLMRIAGTAPMLIPAVPDMLDARSIARRLDGLLLTGSRSNVAPWRYARGAGRSGPEAGWDEARDEVALGLAATMIGSGKPVFGICRGFQELNVLFGGTLEDLSEGAHHAAPDEDVPFHALFAHRHEIELAEGGLLAAGGAPRRITVNSVHRQGLARLGRGLSVEAWTIDDGLVEAISSRPCGAEVLAVQWHPEWETDRCRISRAFFERIGAALRRQGQNGPSSVPEPSAH